MPLENPKYMRKPMLGGFNPAAPSSLAQPMPRELQAEMAGKAVGAQTAGGDPEDEEEESEGDESFDLVATGFSPPVEKPLPQMPADLSPLPPLLGADRINQIFEPLISQIETQGAPQGREVPPPTPALATFLSVLAGSMGAQLTKNPQVRESVIRTLEEQSLRRQAIEDQNYAQGLLFDREQTTRRLAALGRKLDAEFETALEAGKTDQAMKIEQHRAKVAEWMQSRGIQMRGAQDRETQQYTAELKAQYEQDKPEDEETKPLEPKDYIAQRTELLKAKDLKDEGSKGVIGTIGGGIMEGLFGKAGRTRDTALNELDKAAIHSGNPKTAAAAKRNIIQKVLAKLKLSMKDAYSREESVAIQKELQDGYGLSISEVFD